MNNKNPSNHNLKRAKERISATGEMLSEKFTDAQYNLGKFVRKNPGKTIGYSLLAGLILAQLFRRK